MPSRQPLLIRGAQSCLNLALRFWPAESQRWGEALAAELDSIHGRFEAVLWTLGGALLFVRALGWQLLTWLRLPVGSRLSPTATGDRGEPPFLPRRSRLATALLLMSTAVLFLFPGNREALSTVRASWRGFEESAGDLRTLDKLAARAEKEKDARTLAFVAISYSDPQRGMRDAERAVELDPTLYWIYASQFYHRMPPPRPVLWLKQLQASDPENAFCYVLAAEDAVKPRLEALRKKGIPGTQDYATALSNDPEWLRLMGLAFRAPRYDGYFQQRWQLSHEVWGRETSIPFWVIAQGFRSSPVPQPLQIDTFAKILIRRAREEGVAGHTDEAAQILQGVGAFGTRMMDGRNTPFDRSIGLGVSRHALRELHALYTKEGRHAEAQAAAVELQRIDALVKELPRRSGALADPLRDGSFRKARLVQVSTVLLILFGLVAVIGLLSLEVRALLTRRGRTPSERLLCLSVDYAPTMLLAVSLLFLLSFRPFAEYFEQCREGPPAIWFSGYLSGAQPLASSGLGFSHFLSQRWVLAVVGLSLLALFIIVRGLLQRRPAA